VVSEKLTGSEFEPEYRMEMGIHTCSQHSDGTTFAAATPSSLGHCSTVRNCNHVDNSTTEQEHCWKNNTPVLEKLDWNSTTFLLLCIAPYTESTQVKQTIHICMVQAISNNQASWQDKVEVITNRFQQDAPAARAMVEHAIVDLLNYKNICYELEAMELYDLAMRLIPYGNAGVQLPQNTKTRTKWKGFTLFVQPRMCDVRSIVIETQCLPPLVMAQVYVRVLKDPVAKPKDMELLEELKKELLDGPVLKRPSWDRRFYLKTDWSKYAMAVAILQPKCNEEAEEVILKELEMDICNFDKTISGLQLLPIAFISCRCKRKE
jgi:hypothetical protein